MMPAGDDDILDNAIWFALSGHQAGLGEGGPLARRFLPDVSPFAGVKSITPASLEALCGLLPAGESAVLTTRGSLASTEGVRTDYLFDVLQMIDNRDPGGDAEAEAVPLAEADAAEMLALAERTKPGPFRLRTREMGDYFGVRHDGRLIAMAGERMRPGRFVEISAVCVDDAFRGRGLASRLMNTVRRRIYERGQVPFLHVRSTATATIGLYEKLGFAPRALFHLHQVSAPGPG